jgi:hypothetical protein
LIPSLDSSKRLPIPALAEIVCEWEVRQKPQLKKKLGHEQQSLIARQAAATIASQETHASRRSVCLKAFPLGTQENRTSVARFSETRRISQDLTNMQNAFNQLSTELGIGT